MLSSPNSNQNSRGNVFFAIFGAVALIGLLGTSIMTFMKGPLSTAVKLTKMNTAENQMAIGAQVAVMATASQANSGDCDSDGYVEPIEWRAAGASPKPTNGGLVPLTLGINKKDPWGTEYGYCVWNHGAVTSGSGCDANMLTGTNGAIYPVVALVSAGPDKAFTTTCRTFATADVNSDGDLQDATDLEMVSKAAATDDDIIFTYTYEEATGAAGGLWALKSTDPTKATISKDIEVSGSGNFAGGVLLPSSSLITCDGTTAGVMAKNASGTGLQICDGTSWVDITGGAASCASGYTLNGSRCYKVVDMGATNLISWADARTACQADGGDLATLNDASENAAVVTLVSGLGAYIGLSDTALEGTFVWNDASSSYSSWAGGEPNGGAGENCGGLFWGGSGSHDVPCAANGFVEGYVCEQGTSGSSGTGAIDDLTDGITDYITDGNLFMGEDVGVNVVAGGYGNTGIGVGPLYNLTSGNNNTVLGYWALRGPDSWTGYSMAGIRNVAIGAETMLNNTSGSDNVAIGNWETLRENTTGGSNVAIGSWSMTRNTTGYGNVAIGWSGIFDNRGGAYNVSIGGDNMSSSVAASGVVAIGPYSMRYANDSTTAHTPHNTAIGYNALRGSTTPANNIGTDNVALGASALYRITSGSHNVGGTVGALSSLTTGSRNIAFGSSAGAYKTTGSDNIFMGYYAAEQSPAGLSGQIMLGAEAGRLMGGAAVARNLAIGPYALHGGSAGAASANTGNDNIAIGGHSIGGISATAVNNLTGHYNIGIGTETLRANSRGTGSIAIGYQAMMYVNNPAGAATATYNTALGYQALLGSSTSTNNTGTANTALGYQTLVGNTTGSSNVAVGGGNNSTTYGAMYDNTTGGLNVAIGTSALKTNKARNRSIAVGYEAMRYANSTTTSGTTYNTAFGYQALMGSTTAASNTGDANTAIGYQAMLNNADSADNVAIGYQALKENQSVWGQNVAIGNYAIGNATGLTGVVAIGYSAGQELGSNANTAIGDFALQNGQWDNTAIGSYAAQACAGASCAENVAVGANALRNNLQSFNNVAIGYNAGLYAAAGISAWQPGHIVAVGHSALRGSSTLASNTGDSNTAIGSQAGYATYSGSNNVAVGKSALDANTTASQSVAVGKDALGNSTGAQNTAVGWNALGSVTTGTGNVAVGNDAGTIGTGITTGTNNTFIGWNAQSNANNYTNGTALGKNAVLTGSNRIVLGDTAITGIYAQVTSITAISDMRKKKDIEDMSLGLDFISTLRPVQYRYNNGDDTLRFGFIAQETENVLPDTMKPLVGKKENGIALVNMDDDKDHTYRMAYGELTAPLVKAVQEQQSMLDELRWIFNALGGIFFVLGSVLVFRLVKRA